MKLVPYILALALLTGCKGVRPYTANATGEHIAKSSAFVVSAFANVDAAKPHADATGKELLQVAGTQMNSALRENDAASNDVHRTQAELARVTAIAYDYQHSWFGGKYRTLSLWMKIIAGVVLLAVAITTISTHSLFTLPAALVRGAAGVVGLFVAVVKRIAAFVFRLFKKTPKAAG